MKAIALLITILALTGCGTMITVPIDQTLIDKEEATIIILHEQGFVDEFQVFLDREPVGTVVSEKPLKLSVTPGEHELHTEVTAAIDRVTKKVYEAGKVYYMRIWLDIGMWVSSIRVDPTNERESYEVRSHNPDRAMYLTKINKIPDDNKALKSGVGIVTKDKDKIIASVNQVNKIEAVEKVDVFIPQDMLDSEVEHSNISLNPSTLLCIEKIKKSAWYSINSTDIRNKYQGRNYAMQLNDLDKRVEVSCIEQDV